MNDNQYATSITRAARVVLAGVLATILLGGLASCVTPIGMYGHRPEVLWMMKRSPAAAAIPAPRATDHAIVLKRFENRSRNPVGGHFIGKWPTSESIAQGYAAATDLSLPIYEAAYSALTRARYQVWKDYTVHGGINPPPDAADYTIVQGFLLHLEVHTFGLARRVDEAARARLKFFVRNNKGQLIDEFKLEAKVRIRHGKGDLLARLGDEVAVALARRLNKGDSR